MMTDPIADMLTRVRNASSVGKRTVDVPYSRLKRGIAEVLVREGFVADYLEVEAGPRSLLRITLKYDDEGMRILRGIERVSKPGRRVYRGVGDVGDVAGGQGIFVLSTDRGVLSDREAREKGAGGEVLCKVF